MCEFCGNDKCTLTKNQAIAHGAIIEDNASNIMRDKTGDTPQTYCFKNVPAFNSYSAIIPDEDEEDPHLYQRYVFDEDTGCDGDWETVNVQNPLTWQTEKEFLKRLGTNMMIQSQ